MNARRPPFGRRLLAGLLSLLALVTASQALAQVELPFGYISTNPAIISGQISIALEFERQALQLLGSMPASPESIDPINQLIYDSYVLVRFAVSGVREVKSRRPFLGPLLQIQDDLMEDARAALRDCLSELERIRAGSSHNVTPAMESLTRAISRLETLQGLM